MSMLETKVAGVDQAVHDKVGAGQMQQLKSIVMGIQNQANSLEQNIQDKVGAEQMQQVKTTVTQTQAQLTSYEQQLREKAPAAQLQGLKAVLAALEGKLTNCEQALQEKVDAGQVNQLNDAVQVIQKKVGNIERGVWEGMDCVQGLEGALTTLKGQVATVEHNLQEKVCSEDVQRLGDVVISLKGKVGSLEQNFRQGAEHVTDVEGAVVSIGKQLATVKQVFNDMHTTQGRMLTLDLDRGLESQAYETWAACFGGRSHLEVDWAEVVSAFSSRLRGELTTEQLGGFCLFGAVTAYTVVAYHLARGAGDDPIPSTAKNLLARSLMLGVEACGSWGSMIKNSVI
eukprot:g19516.t1